MIFRPGVLTSIGEIWEPPQEEISLHSRERVIFWQKLPPADFLRGVQDMRLRMRNIGAPSFVSDI